MCLGSSLIVFGILLFSGTGPAVAAPEVTAIVQHMKDIFEPEVPRVGNVKITVNGTHTQFQTSHLRPLATGQSVPNEIRLWPV